MKPAGSGRKSEKPSISVAQLLGGALAACLAAVLGSSFGVTGTVVGAAVTSVVTAVATTLLVSGFTKTHETVKAVVRRPAPIEPQPSVPPAQQPSGGPFGHDPRRPLFREPELAPTMTPTHQRRTPRLALGAVAWTAIVTLALAVVAITVFELLAGNALDGGRGTTVGHVFQPSGPSAAKPTETHTINRTPTTQPTPTVETATPTATHTATATISPAVTPTPTGTVSGLTTPAP